MQPSSGAQLEAERVAGDRPRRVRPPEAAGHEVVPETGGVQELLEVDRPVVQEPLPVPRAPELTLYTRRATGYYKVPSLRGLWYRERLFHDGSLSLEEVLDPARLEDDFVPSGFRGADTPSRAVPGHPFGLELAPRERAALIAWLRTL